MIALRHPANVTLNVTPGRRLGKRRAEEPGGKVQYYTDKPNSPSIRVEDSGG